MEQIVSVIVGDWICGENGMWNFMSRNGELGRCVEIAKDTSFIEVENAVSKAFSINRKTSRVALTFWYPSESSVFRAGKMPPVAITSDIDLHLYKLKREEHGSLNLYLTVKMVEAYEEEAFESQLSAFLDVIEAGENAQQISVVDKVNCDSIEKWKKRSQACGQKRIGGDGTENYYGCPAEEDTGVDNLENDRTVVDDPNIDSGVYPNMDNIGMGGDCSMDNINFGGDSGVDNINCTAPSSVDNLDNDDSAEMDLASNESGSEDDYNYDEWSERINQDYPPDWDPYVLGDSGRYGHMALLADVEKGIHLVGETSGERNSQEHDITHIGFSHYLEADGIPANDEDEVLDVRSTSTNDEEGVLARLHASIDRDDPLLLNDAPPFQDSQETNVEAIKGDEGIYVGRIFENKKHLNNVLSHYAMQRVFTYKIWKSDKKRVIAQCMDNKCGWRVYATYHHNSENLEIRTLNMEHNCDVSVRGRYGEKATATRLAELLKPKYANGKKGPRACELPEMVLIEHNVTISYKKAWNAMEMALAASRGTDEESYRYLPTYLHLLKSTNPGTISEMFTKYDTKGGKTLFKYLFFAFGASISGYKYLRKVIVIDGTAMKGKYKGVLVAASGQDGNRQIFPLGFGVVDGETESGWAWFFENLKRFVPDEEELVFVSDRHQSIYAGLRKVYPRAQHGACTVHLFRNVKHNFHCEALASTVSKAARAYTVGEFRDKWAEIEKRNPKCAAYLLNIGLPHWTLSHFKGKRYNLMSSNISESLNAAMTRAVDYPIVAMVEFIRTMLMRWFWCRRAKSARAKTKCTVQVEAILNDHLEKSTACGVLGASDWIYQVNDGKGSVFTVDLANKTCSCRVFDVLQIPCCHALAARRMRNVDEYTLVGECYTVSPWRQLYTGVIMHVPNEKDSYIPEFVTEVAVNPPRTKRPSGRPKKVRIPSQGETHHAKKRKTDNKCQRCSGTGHNRKSCKNPI